MAVGAENLQHLLAMRPLSYYTFIDIEIPKKMDSGGFY